MGSDIGSFAYVWFKKTGVTSLQYVSDPRGHIVKAHDRIVLLARRDAHVTGWDAAYCLDPYRKNSIGANRVTEILTSVKPRAKPPDFPLFMDSGGAQLKFGTKDYVDPIERMYMINKWANTGTALDVPPRPADYHDDIVRACAEAQRTNNKHYESVGKRDGVVMLNSLHGFSLEQAEQYADTVESDFFDGWAVGCDNPDWMWTNLQTLLVALERKPTPVRVHVFGASNSILIPILCWLSHKTGIPITSDSATPLYAARKRQFDVVTPRMQTIRSQWLNGLQPPCSCPACQITGDAGFYNTDHVFLPLLLWHNIFAKLRYANYWNTAAQRSSFFEYCKLSRVLFMGKGIQATAQKERTRYMLSLLKYVDYAAEHGARHAAKEFSYELDNPIKGEPHGRKGDLTLSDDSIVKDVMENYSIPDFLEAVL